MDQKDKILLTEIQKRFPLESAPYQSLARKLSISEEEVITRLNKLKKAGILRQIGAIFNPHALGYQTSLVAAAVPEEKFSQAADVINAFPGVSHNYLRNHFYNMWFTIAVPPNEPFEETLAELIKKAGVSRFLILPIKRIFHIAVVYDLNENHTEDNNIDFSFSDTDMKNFLVPDEKTISLVKLTQEDLPRVSRPFQEIARKIGLDEGEVLSWIKDSLNKGIIRRFAGLVRHTRAGVRGNIMVAWEVPEDQLEKVGKALAKEKKITHCYERKSYPEWPYNLYTMVHAQSPEEALIFIENKANELKISSYLPLETIKELKKTRLKLFW
ncbi:siroheme decarboxylase subunit alpha [Thermodesulfatator indicus]